LASLSNVTNHQALRAAFYFILVTIALISLAFGIIAPVLPDLVRQFEGGDFARASDMIGYFAFAWSTMQFLFSPVLGAWSDRFGRRPVIPRFLPGVRSGLHLHGSRANLTLALCRPHHLRNHHLQYRHGIRLCDRRHAPDKRAKPFGLISAAFGFGFVIGPALGGWLGSHNLRVPFWGAAVLCLANALYGYFVLPESLPPERRSNSAWHMANPLGSLRLLRSRAELSGLALVITLYYLAHQSLVTVWALYAEYRYAWSRRDVGLSLAVVGVSAALVSGVLVAPFVKKFGERRSVLAGLMFGTLGFLGFGLARRGWVALAVIPLIALWGIAAPACKP
jgi:DHA1 family tetracycline resistance protein-like MFS transporter